MNTTREQRAEAYARLNIAEPYHATKQFENCKQDHIAGAAEEAAIKDAVILRMTALLEKCLSFENSHYEDCTYHEADNEEDCDCGTSKTMQLIREELAKGKV